MKTKNKKQPLVVQYLDLCKRVKQAMDALGVPSHHPIKPGAKLRKPMMPQERLQLCVAILSDKAQHPYIKPEMILPVLELQVAALKMARAFDKSGL